MEEKRNEMNLKQLKSIHGLVGKKVSYGIIKVTSATTGQKNKPGLYIKGSKLFFDLLNQRFYSALTLSELKREIVPAKMHRSGGMLLLRADDGTELKMSAETIESIYVGKFYQSWMEEQVLL